MRPSQRVPKYRRHKACNLAVVRLGGKDHYLGPYGSKESKVKYQRLIQEWKKQLCSQKQKAQVFFTETFLIKGHAVFQARERTNTCKAA